MKTLNNKGYSLVELLMTILIMGIVMLGVAMIMRTTSVSYRNGNSEVAVQSEAQIVANQIEELMVDSTDGISGVYHDGSGKRVCSVTTGIYKHWLVFDASVSKLYYSKTGSSEGSYGSLSLMADYVTDFDVTGWSPYDATNTDPQPLSDNMVTVEISMDNDGYVYSAVKDVYFRNAIENKTVQQIGSSTPTADPNASKYKVIELDRYQVIDLKKDYDIRLVNPSGVTDPIITPSSKFDDTYDFVLITYNNTSNTDLNKAITKVEVKTLDECVTAVNEDTTNTLSIGIRTNDTFSKTLTTAVPESDDASIVFSNETGDKVYLRFFTKAVAGTMTTGTSLAGDGLIYLVTESGDGGRYSWVDVDGIDVTSMIAHTQSTTNKISYQYAAVMYKDANDNKKYDDGEMYEKIPALQGNSFNSVGHNMSTIELANSPKILLGVMVDPEGTGFVVNQGTDTCTLSDTDKAAFAGGNIRAAFMVTLPGDSEEGHLVMDLTLAVPGQSMTNYKGGNVYFAQASEWGLSF